MLLRGIGLEAAGAEEGSAEVEEVVEVVGNTREAVGRGSSAPLDRSRSDLPHECASQMDSVSDIDKAMSWSVRAENISCHNDISLAVFMNALVRVETVHLHAESSISEDSSRSVTCTMQGARRQIRKELRDW